MSTAVRDIKCIAHNLQCTRFISHKQSGRAFYRCSLPIGDAGRCDTFKWEDELPEPKNRGLDKLPPTPPSIVPNIPSTPVQTQKRTFSQLFEDEPLSSPSSQKRARIIEATSKRNTRDDEHPFLISTPPRRQASFRLTQTVSAPFRPTQTSLTEAGPSSYLDDGVPVGSQETIIGDAEELNAESIQLFLAKFAVFPQYVKKLERQKFAAERSRDIKAQKIRDLEQENRKLRLRMQELEELVAIFESES